ncbi:MAG TPA: winged helix-turn-helix domain-containing protein [Capillimicrobium sp.]|nr:winged helix-turn-helix domain-containing protein [Capillimicrobium sp.]
METASDVLRAGDVEIRTSDGLVIAGGRVIPMSLREYRLLRALVQRENRIVSREDLYRLAWDAALRDGDRSVDVYIHKLRVKLERALPGHAFIHTHFGFGYRFAQEPAPALRDATARR